MTVIQRKPVDVGNGRVTASFAANGSWLSAGGLHPVAGLVEVVAVPAFTGTDGDGNAVRAHRRRLADPTWCVLALSGAESVWDPDDRLWSTTGQGWAATTQAWAPPDRSAAVQRHQISTDGPGALRLRWRGRIDHPAYAMITPVGPTPGKLPETTVVADGAVLKLEVPGYDPPLRAEVQVTCRNADVGTWQPTWDGAELDVHWEDSRQDIVLSVQVTPVAGRTSPERVPSEAAPPVRPSTPEGVLDRIVIGSGAYTRDCAAVAYEDGTCLVTDHRLLPLSWTRDAYYQAALLLAIGDATDMSVVERHLTWLWGPGRDADGVWQRSHFATGEVKDRVYQADQQLYPLLELADFRRVTGRWPQAPYGTSGDESPAIPWGSLVRRTWLNLPRDENGLLPGAENPADDPAGLPYLLSSQLLMAYVARRLAEWQDELDLRDLDLDVDSARLLDRVEETFTCAGPYGPQWAYEADAMGRTTLYHDANDVPTACAAVWGLCPPDHRPWRNTMRFAWSAHNPGYVEGRLGGLGSRHTPGVWPLGDAQLWAVSTVIGDQEGADAVVEKFSQVTSADGMLPETYDPDTGEWWARDWFAWPGSLTGLLALTLGRSRGPWVERLAPRGTVAGQTESSA